MMSWAFLQMKICELTAQAVAARARDPKYQPACPAPNRYGEGLSQNPGELAGKHATRFLDDLRKSAALAGEQPLLFRPEELALLRHLSA